MRSLRLYRGLTRPRHATLLPALSPRGTTVPAATHCSLRCASTSAPAAPAARSTAARAPDVAAAAPNIVAPAQQQQQQQQDIGPIESRPVTSVDVARDLHGPWVLLIGSELEGELFVRRDGTCFFRPGQGLGHGVGRLRVVELALGPSVVLDLETYLYAATSREPPASPKLYTLTLTVAEAVAEASAYRTFVMSGNALAVDELRSADGADNTATGPRRQVGQANAAKLEPWNPAMDAAPAWVPNETLVRTFKAVFPEPLLLDRLAKPLPPASAASWLPPFASGGAAAAATARAVAAPLNLAEYRVGAPVESIFYIPNYVSEAEEAACLRQLADTPAELKKPLDRRVVQEYGGVMCPTCNMSFVTDVNQPPWTATICDALTRDRVFSPSVSPNNTRVHEYEPGHGIAPHCDGPIYVPRVAILSLANPVLMSFYARRPVYDDVMEHYNDTFRFEGAIAKERPIFSLVLEPRSLLVFERDAYWHHPHGISAKLEDSLLEADVGPIANRHLVTTISEGQTTLPRKYRVGVTMRNLLPRCQHHEDRAEYCMAHAQRIYLGETAEGIFADPMSGCDRVPASPPAAAQVTTPTSKTFAAATAASSTPALPVPALAAPPPSTTAGAADAELMAAMRGVQRSLDVVLRQQQDLAKQMQEMQVVLALQTQSSHKFTSETATVLDHMSSVVLDLQASVEDIRSSTEHNEAK